MSFLLASTSHYIGIALDIAIVFVLLTFAFIGYHHGFFKSLLGLFSTVVVVIIAVYFANSFAGIINKIYDFTALIAKNLTPAIEKISSVYGMTFPDGMSGSQFYNGYIASSNTNSILKKFFKYILKGYKAENIEGLKVAEVLAGGISSLIMTLIAGIVLFILIKIALGLLSRFFDNITKIKVLGGLNKIFGFAFGAIKGGIIVLFFVVITIFVSFVPDLNKKIYPLINDDTKVVKVIYNTTDNLLEKYFIKTDTISKWVNNLWDNRKLKKSESIADKASVIAANSFVMQSEDVYLAIAEDKEFDKNKTYYRVNTLDELNSFTNVTIMITFDYESENNINFEMYDIDQLKNPIIKDQSSTTRSITYTNISYDDFILSINTTNGEIISDMSIIICGVTA